MSNIPFLPVVTEIMDASQGGDDRDLALALQLAFDEEQLQQQLHQRRQPALTLGTSPPRCPGCGQPSAGARYHPGCLRCAACGGPIGAGAEYVEGRSDGASERPGLYHPACHAQARRPPCDVCGALCPLDAASGRVSWQETPFWRQKLCGPHPEALRVRLAFEGRAAALDLSRGAAMPGPASPTSLAAPPTRSLQHI